MFNAALAAFNRSDVSSELHRIRTRTLVLAGRQDPAVTSAQADFIAAQIPGAEFKVLDEASQLAAIEKPFEVARLVRDFLGRTASIY
jgi:3-oxoadipate enol-lactonase